MARKYTRDNRGRFASGGGGATARGGRLKTAGGNKRATQTMRAQGAGGDGVIRGRAARTVAGQKVMGKLAKRPEPAKAAPKAAPQRIEGPMRTGGTRSRLSGRKMSEGAGKRGAARQERQAAMAGMRGMLGRTKPGASAEPLSTGGTLAARASLTRARSKAGAAGASPAQRGAATRANTYAKASVQRNTVALKGGGISGTIAKPKAAKPAAPAQAKAAPKAAKVPANSFDTQKRRIDRTRFENSGLTFNTDDRPGRFGSTKNLVAGLNRKRAFGVYRAQAARPLGELSTATTRAPFGRFSTVKNPAPAKAFPSQAPGRTKKAELAAREYRKAAKGKRK